MAISPVQLPINNPQLFINMATVNDIRNRKYRWLDQPLWPAKNVYFTTTEVAGNFDYRSNNVSEAC